MAAHAPEEIEGEDPHTRLMRQLNYFPTPPWATRAVTEILGQLVPGTFGSVLEPCCGEGHMAGPLGETFGQVHASDIYDHGRGFPVADFLDRAVPFARVDWTVINPPFKAAAEFIERGLLLSRYGVASLGRLQFVEAAERYPLMSAMALHCPFSERVSMRLGVWTPGQAGKPGRNGRSSMSGATAYAWFIWLTAEGLAASPWRDAIVAARRHGAHLERLIGPGTLQRLTLPDDAVRWAQPGPTPLLDLVAP